MLILDRPSTPELPQETDYLNQRISIGQLRSATLARHTEEFLQRNTSQTRIAYIRDEAIRRNIANGQQHDLEQLRDDLLRIERETVTMNTSHMLWWSHSRRHQTDGLQRMSHYQYQRRLLREENRLLILESKQPFGFIQARRVNDMLRPNTVFGSDDWYPTDGLQANTPWTRNWRGKNEIRIFDSTPGDTNRRNRIANAAPSRYAPGEWPMTPDVREWREETVRAVNTNSVDRNSISITGAPPGYVLEYESDHSSDDEADLPEFWFPGFWYNRGTINLRWTGRQDAAVNYFGIETRAIEVGNPIRIELRRFASNTLLDIIDNIVDTIISDPEDNPFAGLS